jgi:hypothetical protein
METKIKELTEKIFLLLLLRDKIPVDGIPELIKHAEIVAKEYVRYQYAK